MSLGKEGLHVVQALHPQLRHQLLLIQLMHLPPNLVDYLLPVLQRWVSTRAGYLLGGPCRQIAKMLLDTAVQRLHWHGVRCIRCIEDHVHTESSQCTYHLGLLMDAGVINESHDLPAFVLLRVPEGLEGAVDEVLEDDCVLISVQ